MDKRTDIRLFDGACDSAGSFHMDGAKRLTARFIKNANEIDDGIRTLHGKCNRSIVPYVCLEGDDLADIAEGLQKRGCFPDRETATRRRTPLAASRRTTWRPRNPDPPKTVTTRSAISPYCYLEKRLGDPCLGISFRVRT